MTTLIDPRFFRALCDPNRVALLVRLAQCRRACSVGELAQCCPVDFSVVSRHLATLRDAGIVEANKQGKEVFYTVCHEYVASTLKDLAASIEACCPKD